MKLKILFSLFAFSLLCSGVSAYCDGLVHLRVGVWSCTNTMTLNVLNTDGLTNIDFGLVYKGCTFTHAVNTFNSALQTLRYTDYTCNNSTLCDGNCGQPVSESDVVFSDDTCTQFSDLGVNGKENTCVWQASVSPASSLAPVFGSVVFAYFLTYFL